MNDVTRILSPIERGEPQASEQLLPLVYDELRELAARRLAREKPGQTLQATALVHEAYLRLVDAEVIQRWDSRGHFFAAAAEAMRRILVDHARRRGNQKRGGHKVELEEAALVASEPGAEIVALDEALKLLAEIDPRRSRVVELRFFAGLPVRDVAETLGVTTRTIERDWMKARLFLLRELEM